MKTILIAIGNTLRGDDGVANRVLELLGPLPGVDTRSVHQLVPEIADEIAGHGRVLFIDADLLPGQPGIEPVAVDRVGRSPLGHTMRAAEIVALSRSLFGFAGEAWLCRIPVYDFSNRETLSRDAEQNAMAAADLIRRSLSAETFPYSPAADSQS